MNKKILAFQKELQKKNIDIALLYTMDTGVVNTNLLYLANYSGYGFLVVPAQGESILLVPLLDLEYAKNATVPHRLWDKNVFEIIAEKYGKIHLEKIGVEEKKYSIFLASRVKKKMPNIQFIDVADILDILRSEKDEDEQLIMKKACAMTDKLLSDFISEFDSFKTEFDAQQYMKKTLLEKDLEFSFPIIIASGKNPSSPHHIPSKEKMQKGFCVIDFGIKYKNYCSDMTRTIFLGKPTREEKELYNLLLHVQEKSIDFCKQGISFFDVEQNARKMLGKYEKDFVHSLGHGLGLDVHENITFGKDPLWKITENQVFTIEPGIYVKDRFGMRIEDDILMKKKPVIMTKMTKELIVV